MSDFIKKLYECGDIYKQVYELLIDNCDTLEGNVIFQRFLDDIDKEIEHESN